MKLHLWEGGVKGVKKVGMKASSQEADIMTPLFEISLRVEYFSEKEVHGGRGGRGG